MAEKQNAYKLYKQILNKYIKIEITNSKQQKEASLGQTKLQISRNFPRYQARDITHPKLKHPEA